MTTTTNTALITTTAFRTTTGVGALQERKTLEAGKALLLARSAFAKEYIQLWHMTTPCDEATGLRILARFRQEIETYVFKYDRRALGVKHAANELFRLVAVGSADYTFADVTGFVRWYEQLKERIAKAIGDLYDYHGDSFGDLCDALPLADPDIVARCLATGRKPKRDGFLDSDEIPAAIEAAGDPKWRQFICNGENYIASALEHRARKWLLRELVGSEEWFPTAEDQEAVSYAHHDDNDD